MDVRGGGCTVFSVEGDLHLPLFSSQQSFGHLSHGRSLGVGPVQEAAGARLLHHLGPAVATHPTEAVITEDDGAVLHLSVGDDELAI